MTTFCLKSVPCDKKQAYRFMGVKGEVNADLDALYEHCLAFVNEKAAFKAVWRKTAVEINCDKVKLDFCTIESAALCKNLKGCKSAYVFAATIGSEVDRLLLRLNATSAGKAVMADCIASSLIECFCDRVNEEIAKGKKTRPRFSPGYGGVSLCCQKEVLAFLDANKTTGISLTDSFMMVPRKSVTAIIGVEDEDV